MEYVYDLPEDARADCTYGTPEFEAKRLSRWELPKRHVKPVGPVVPTDAKAMLARYAEIRRRFRDAGIPERVVTAPVRSAFATKPLPVFKRAVVLYEECATTCPTRYPYHFGPYVLNRGPRLFDIANAVVEYYEARLDELTGPYRGPRVVRPRMIAMYLGREILGRSFPEIGRYFCRDHSTAVHAVQKITVEMATDEALAADIAAITAWIKGDKAGGHAVQSPKETILILAKEGRHYSDIANEVRRSPSYVRSVLSKARREASDGH